MSKLVSAAVLFLVSASVFAGPVLVPPQTGTVPEPEVLSLLGIGMAAVMLSRRSKK